MVGTPVRPPGDLHRITHNAGTTKPPHTAEPAQLSLRFNLLNTKVSALLRTSSGIRANDAKQIISLCAPLEALPCALWPHRPRLLWFTGSACTCTVVVRSPGTQQHSLKGAESGGGGQSRGEGASLGAACTPGPGTGSSLPILHGPLFFPSQAVFLLASALLSQDSSS